jgi:hypothetical protein
VTDSHFEWNIRMTFFFVYYKRMLNWIFLFSLLCLIISSIILIAYKHCMWINNSKYYFKEASRFIVITFSKLRNEEKRFQHCSLMSILLLCFRYLHSKCKPKTEDRVNLRIVGLNYSLEKKRKKERERAKEFCL